ncbi:hypothetical protein [Rhizobium sp. LCM 4573]|uniref:hypothetical protein n=1 Tax=Rhizobium sp. LCM 4573 TaxID=1848291 RepID=UPI00091A5ECF|nr:hypothetical protein [Rhizobium sp. LCM 4573]OHV83657.1 hypothetical protein LCM4573_06005 [Rhizobium sp. LCM 4573]
MITTEHPVRRFLPDPRQPQPIPDGMDCSYIEMDEVLVAAGVDLSRAPRMPLIDCHDTYSGIEKILGKIDDVRVEGTAVVGRASLARKHAELLPDIIDGYFGQISAGYDYDLRRDTELVEREGDVPLLLVKRWLLTEGSLVPVGADPNSFIRSLHGFVPSPTVRSADSNKPEEKKMDIEALVKAAEDAVASAEEAIGAAEDAIPEDLVERIRALRGARAEDDTTAAAEEETTDGERAEGDDPTDEEKQEVEAVRSIAKGYGLEKVVTDMRALGARAADIKSAVAKTIAERGAPTADVAVAVKPAARSAVAAFDPSAVFAARNKR